MATKWLWVCVLSASAVLGGVNARLHAEIVSADKGAGTPSYGSNPDKGAYAQINGARIYSDPSSCDS